MSGWRQVANVCAAGSFPARAAPTLSCVVRAVATCARRGVDAAKQQVSMLLRFFLIAFVWDAIKWVFSGDTCAFCEEEGVSCQGLESLPILVRGW